MKLLLSKRRVINKASKNGYLGAFILFALFFFLLAYSAMLPVQFFELAFKTGFVGCVGAGTVCLLCFLTDYATEEKRKGARS